MKISWNWLSEYVDLDKFGTGAEAPRALAQLLTARGLEVEGIERQDQGLEKVITAKILERAPHPQADRLSLCKVSIDGKSSIEVVCGAQNMKAGDVVALAQVGAKLPNGLKIETSKIRGVISNGMLCSEAELKLSEESKGIIVLPSSTALGRPLAEILNRTDTIFEIKLTPNRADCLSHFGIAREVASAIGQKLKLPQIQEVAFTGSPISTTLEGGEDGLQFLGAYLEAVKIGPSPAWLKDRLESIGLRSINNVVDATNFLLMELGQPVHAYDASRLDGKSLAIRRAKPGEKLPLLDGTEIALAGTELVIADAKKAVALAGVMGGGNSEVRDTTTQVFLEVAEFSPTLVRKAAKAHQKNTDASHRFERGVNPEGQSFALFRLIELVTKVAGGKVVGATRARHGSREKFVKSEVVFATDFIQNFLGLDLDVPRIESILKGLECEVKKSGTLLRVTPPSYRLDLNIPEDFAEEIARVVGYDEIPATIPTLSTAPTIHTPEYTQGALIERAKDVLVQIGLHEMLQYAFTSEPWLREFDAALGAVRVLNPISEDQSVLVPTLLPGLIWHAIGNLNRNFGSESVSLRWFELRPTFHLRGDLKIEATSETETGIQEKLRLACLLSGPRVDSSLRSEAGKVDFYDLKALFESFFEKLGTRGIRMRALTATDEGSTRWYHPGQAIEVWAGKERVGVFGRLHPGLEKKFKLRQELWVGELDWAPIAVLSAESLSAKKFKPWSAWPSIERDFALNVKGDIESEKIVQSAIKAGRPLAQVVKVFDIYKGSQVAQGMTSVAVRVIFGSEDRSLQEAEADQASTQILNAWKKELGIELRT